MNQSSLPDTAPARALRRHLLALYREMLAVSAPPENLIGGYLRKNKEIRGGARGFLASVAFALLRARIRTRLWMAAEQAAVMTHNEAEQWLIILDPASEAAAGVARWILEDLSASASERAAALRDLALDSWMDRLANRPIFGDSALQLAFEASIHPTLAARWQGRFPYSKEILAGVRSPAGLHLWFPDETTRDQASAALTAEGLPWEHGTLAPTALRLLVKKDLRRVPGMERLRWIVQDEGSQLVSLALSETSGGALLDACAGAGGKTINLAARFPNRPILATDVDEQRLEIGRRRCAEQGVDTVRWVPAEEADKLSVASLLIDAPCTGLGTLRRDPSLQWRAPLAQSIAQAVAAQRACLQRWLPRVAPGGEVVYATCSVEEEETYAHEPLIRSMGFEPTPLPALIPRRLLHEQSTLVLPPHREGTDGFFIARYRRT